MLKISRTYYVKSLLQTALLHLLTSGDFYFHFENDHQNSHRPRLSGIIFPPKTGSAIALPVFYFCIYFEYTIILSGLYFSNLISSMKKNHRLYNMILLSFGNRSITKHIMTLTASILSQSIMTFTGISICRGASFLEIIIQSGKCNR